MATVFSTATLGLNVDTKQFSKDISSTQRLTVKALEDMQSQATAFDKRWRDLTGSLKDTKRVVSGILISQGFYAIMNALTGAASAALQFSSAMEQASISLEYFVDSAVGTEEAAAKVTAYLREVNEFAARTPFNTDQVLSLSKYMQSVGVAMGQTQSVLTVLTDAAAATGATSENLERIVFALGQMLTKGRIANEEIRQLANANIPIYDILQDELGLTGAQISNIGKYWVDADKAVVAILNGLEKRYQGAADRIAETFAGMKDTIIDDAKIIAREAFDPLYDKLTDATRTIRDTLDDWRNIVTEKGTPGLFNDVILHIDPTGKLGNDILATVGNLLQLKDAFIELYHAASPVLSVIGKSFSASINVGLVALTALAKTINGVIDALDKMGISTGVVGKGIASLYVAYKATQFVSLLGQALASAGVAGYQAASGLLAVLPASMSANAGVVALTASVATLIAYLVTAASLFGMINNSFAGLSAENGSSGLNNNWQTAYEEYLAQMEDYDAAVDAYRAKYEESYKNLGDPSEVSLKQKDDDDKKKSGGSKDTTTKEWVAAFDEVYDVPNEDEPTGGQLDDILDDFTDLIDLLEANFPFPSSIDLPEKPTFNFGDVYGDSIWDDTGAADADFWRHMLPGAIMGLVLGLGKAFAKQQADQPKYGDATPPTKTGKVDAFSDEAVILKKLDDLQDVVSTELKTLNGTMDRLEVAIQKRIKANTPESLDELKRLSTTLDAQLELFTKNFGQLGEIASYANKSIPLLADGAVDWHRAQELLANSLQLERQQLLAANRQFDLTQGEYKSITERLTAVDKRLKQLQAGSVAMDLSSLTPEDLAKALTDQAERVTEAFTTAFSGPLKRLADGTRGYNLAAIAQADAEYKLLEELSAAYKLRAKELTTDIDALGVKFLRLFDANSKEIRKALDTISSYGVSRNVAGTTIETARHVGISPQELDVQNKIIASVDHADQLLRDIAVDMRKLNPEAIAEANAEAIRRAISQRLEAGIKEVAEANTDVVTNVQNAWKAIDRARRQAALQATEMQSRVARAQAELEIIETRTLSDIQADIRTQNSLIKAAKQDLSELKEAFTLADTRTAAGAKYAQKLFEDIDEVTRHIHELEYTLAAYQKELADILGSSSVAQLKTLPEVARGTLESYDKFTAALEKATPHLSGLDDAVEELRGLLNSRLSPELSKALDAIGMSADQLVATGTKFQVLTNGLDAFSGSIPMLTDRIFGDLLKITGRISGVESAFTRMTAALGVTLEPVMRYALALDAMDKAVGIVHGTGHAALPGQPIIVQNDASVAFFKALNETLNDNVQLLSEIGVDFKVTTGSVVDTLSQFVVDEVNGIKVITSNALLAANKPSWYYEFIPHLEAFGANNRRELISILNRDFDFKQLGDVLVQKLTRSFTAGNGRTDIVDALEGRFLSTDAVRAYASFRPALAGLDEETITKLYFEEVIRPAFTNGQGFFDVATFRKLMTEFVVDYSGVDVKAITGLADYFYAMNEAIALLVANKQVPGDLSKAYFSVVRDGQEVFSEMDFAPVLRSYNDFSRSITGWFDSLLGPDSLKGIETRGLFTHAPVRSQIDKLVRTYNQAIRAGEDAAAAMATFREGMQKISATARMLAGSSVVPAELDGLFLSAGQDIAKYGAALGKLAEATEILAEVPMLTSELPRTIRTTVDAATRLNFQIENGLAVTAYDVATLSRSYNRLIELLHLQTDSAAYQMGQQIDKLNELMKATGAETRILSSAEAFKIELPVHIANIQEHLSIWGNKLLKDIDDGVIQVADSVEKEIRGLFTGLLQDINYAPLDATLRAAKQLLPQIMSFVDIEASGFPIQTATGAIQPRPVQISAINPAGEQHSWLVNWGTENRALLDYMRSINADFEKAFSSVTVDMMDAANDIDTVMREVYQFTQADKTLISGYNASNIGGYDLDILNAWMPDGKTFLPGADVMRLFNEEVNKFIQFGKDIKLVEAYEISVGTLDDLAHLADNDIAMTYEVWKRIKDGTVARIAETASGLTEVSGTFNKLQAAASMLRGGQIAEAAEELAAGLNEVVTSAQSIAYPLSELDPGVARVIKNTLGPRIGQIQDILDYTGKELNRLTAAIEQVGDPDSVKRFTAAAAQLTEQRASLEASLEILQQQHRIATIGALSMPAREQIVASALDELRKSGVVSLFGENVRLTGIESGFEVTQGTFKYQAATLDEAISYVENYFKNITGLAEDAAEGFSGAAHVADAAADVIGDTTYAASQAADHWKWINSYVKQLGGSALGEDIFDDAAKILFSGTNDLLEDIPDSFLKSIYGVSDDVVDTFRRIAAGTADEVIDLFDGVEDAAFNPSIISRFMGRARSFGEAAYEKFFQYFGFGFSNTRRLDLKAVPELMDAIDDYAEAFGKLQVAGAKADEAFKLWKSVPDQSSDLAKGLKQAYALASDEFKAAGEGLEEFRTRFFNSLIIKTREGLRSAQTLDFESFGKVLSSGSDKVAYYIDQATGEWKLIGETITTDGEGLLKGYAKLAEAGTFGEKVAKEVGDAMGDLQAALKSGENIHTAMRNLSDAVKDSFADFQKGAVIYDVADDVYYAGDYAAKQVNRAAAAIDESFESFGRKLLKFNIASYSLFDIADIVISGIRQSEQDIKNEDLAGLFVESLLSDEVTELIKAAGLNTGELVADNIYEGAAQAVGQSVFVNGIINVLMMAISGVVGGIPGLIIGGLSAVATSLGMNSLFGNDESSKAINTWSSMLAGREHGGIFGLGAASPYDTTEFERLLRESGTYAEQEIADLVVAARITDTATLLDAIKADNGGIVSADDLAKVVELASTNSLYQAFRFITSTPTDNIRGNNSYENILYGSGYTKDMYVGRNDRGYGIADWIDTDIARGLNSLNMAQGDEVMAVVRIAAAMGAINATSIAQAHQGQNGIGSWVSSEMVLPLESAAADLETIKKILGEDYAGLQLGAQIAVNGKEYVRVLDATGNAVRYFGDDTEALRAMIKAMYAGGAQEGDFTETLRGIIDGNDYLKQALVENMGYDQRAIIAYDNIQNYLALLAESDSSYREITGYTLDENPGMAVALMQQQLDIWDAYEQAKLTELGISTATHGAVGGNIDVLAGNTAQYITGAILEGITPTMLAQLTAAGITLGSGSSAYETALQGPTAIDYITVGTDQDALIDALRGITVDAHGVIVDLDGQSFDVGALSVTTDEAAILAEAGIQVNSNGTVSFMYNHNEARTGNERGIALSAEHFSQAIIDQLGEYSIGLNFDTSEIEFGNFDKVKESMTAAMFKLSDSIGVQMSENMEKIIADIGTITEDGFLKITNEAVLSGDVTLKSALDALDWTGVSDIVKNQFYSIAALVDEEGGTVQDNLIEWANAVVVPSPIKEEDLTEEIRAAFRSIGIAFTGAGEEFQMIISNTGEKITNGFTLISNEKWESLSTETVAALEALGVKTTEAGNQVLVDLSQVMEDGAGDIVAVFVNKPELWDQLPDTVKQYLEEAGIVADEQLLEIDRKIGKWLVETTDGWIASWESIDQPTKDALATLGLDVDEGMLAIAGYVDGADIPETVDREALIPFNALPDELQTALSQVDKNCETKMYDIKNTASSGFTELESVLNGIAGAVAGAADEMATSIANAVTRAMTNMQQLESLQSSAGRTGGFLGIGSSKNNVVYKGTDKLGNTYYGEYTAKGKLVKYIRVDSDTGQQTTVDSLPKFAAGGIVDPTASSLPILAGELGKELAILPNGKTQMLDAGLYDLPNGTHILNANDTKMVQKYAGSRPTVKAFAKGTASLSVRPALDSFMPDSAQGLRAALGVVNGGVVTPVGTRGSGADMTGLIDAVTRGVLERVLPAVATVQANADGADDRTPIYVGTLIADDAGLRTLERKLYSIRQAESMRRG